MVLPPARDRQVDIGGRQFDRPHAAPGALPRQQGGAGAAERLEHNIALVGVGFHQEGRQLHREHRGVLGLDAALLVPGDAHNVVGDPEVLDRPAFVRIAAHRAVGPAQAGHQQRIAGPFAGDDLVGLARLPVEVEEKLERRREAAIPVSGQAGALALWKGQGAEVLLADTLIDSQFIPWLEARHGDLRFQRVDAELDDSLHEPESELADADGVDNGEKLRGLFKAALANDKVTVQVQSLKGEGSPAALILLPEQMRRLNDMGALMEQRLPGLPDHHVLLVNRRHPLVEGLLKLSSGAVITGGGSSPSLQLAEDLSRHVYEMARLAVGGLEPNQLAGFQQRSADLMGQLMQRGL